LELDGIPVRFRCELEGGDVEAGRRRDGLVVDELEQRGRLGRLLERLGTVYLFEELFSARDVGWVVVGIAPSSALRRGSSRGSSAMLAICPRQAESAQSRTPATTPRFTTP